MTKLSSTFDNVTCPRCRKALEASPANERGFPEAGKVYNVGNIGKAEMGHQMYFSSEGRVALCIAKPKES